MPDLFKVIAGASTEASAMDALFAVLLTLSTAITVVIAGLIVLFVIKYRRRPGNLVAAQVEGSTQLELIWTIVPLILALGVFGWAARLYYELAVPPANALDVYVVGKQWMWEFQHVGGQREINALHVPLGQPVRLTMTSQDVIHSFYVPAFRIKQDLLPGRYTTTWFQATQTGTYALLCAEYCGTLHSGMRAQVVVMPTADYQRWLLTGETTDPVSVGERLFDQYGCSGCHHSDGSGIAPSLVGVYGSRVRFAGGETAVADDNYIRESIVHPTAQVVQDYQAVMPAFEGQLSEDQLLLLLMYIKSLSNGGSGTASTGVLAPASTSTP